MEQQQNSKYIAFFLCFCLLLLYKQFVYDPYFNGKGKQPVQTSSAGSSGSSVAGSQTSSLASQTPTTPQVEAPAGPTDDEMKASGGVTAVTKDLRVRAVLLGGRLSEVSLLNYKVSREPESKPLNLVEHADKAPLPLGVTVGNEDDSRVLYRLVQPALTPTPGNEATIAVPEKEDRSLVLEGTLPSGTTVIKTLRFAGSGYVFNVTVAALRDGVAVPYTMEWTRAIDMASATLLDPYQISGYSWFDGERASHQSYAKLVGDRVDFGNVGWVSMADKYFLVAVVSPAGPTAARAVRRGSVFSLQVDGEADRGLNIFAGPKSYGLLQDAGYELWRNLDFGRTGFIAAPLLSLLHFFHGIFGNYGVAIVLLTVLVKTLLYPLTLKSYRASRAMQDIAPEVARIRESVKDPQQQQMEMMALYKKRGVNPLGGCLPALVQMPIFIGLYSALMMAVELRHAPFALWIHDLAHKEELMAFGFPIPVMVILFVISMIYQQHTMPTNLEPAQKRVMMAMPLVFGFMLASLPAGLTLYTLTNNMISLGQQRAMQKRAGREAFLISIGIAVAIVTFALILSWI